jgi:hypothetical protein
MGVEMAQFIDKELEKRFFKESCSFSPDQLRRADDMCSLMQAIMLLDENYIYASISAVDAKKYIISVKDDFSDERKQEIESLVDYLGDAFIEVNGKDKFAKKINIPMLFIMARKAIALKVDCPDFLQWYNEFFGLYKPDCEYAQYCSTGSIKKEKTLGRIRIMTEHFDKFFKDYNIQE